MVDKDFELRMERGQPQSLWQKTRSCGYEWLEARVPFGASNLWLTAQKDQWLVEIDATGSYVASGHADGYEDAKTKAIQAVIDLLGRTRSTLSSALWA